ncbi:MAG: ATP-grasp domain-containing protein [bacterium]
MKDSSLSLNDSTENVQDEFAEWDTIETISAVKDALALYHDVEMIEADENAFEKLRKSKPEIVFNIAEGKNGISREAQIPAMLDMLGIPCTGSDALTLATCLDKARSKEILSYHKIPTAKFFKIENISELDNIEINFPVFIKPNAEGSSKGIFNESYICCMEDLKSKLQKYLSIYKQPFIVEEYLPGREFTVAVLGNNGDARVLPIVEINFHGLPKEMKPIYSFETKWIYDTRETPLDIFTCPANIDAQLEQKISSHVLRTYRVLNCRDWSRIDVRMDTNGEPNIIEVNPLPGILPDPIDNSCFPKAARTAGIDYNEMINSVLIAAAKRQGLL